MRGTHLFRNREGGQARQSTRVRKGERSCWDVLASINSSTQERPPSQFQQR
ncbi:hypothetical protein R3I93_015307 [Phoxinus phoxinus]|uniref:Uncharacterized protein n=1 Tax=Phoxinus phoxinus TaxID=58324 RepID=A0AAN9CQW8_9TELE